MGYGSHLLLIGFPGCGKTTLASKLAKKSNLEVIDTDLHLTELYRQIHNIRQTNCSLIYRHLGEKQFRGLELEVLKRLQTSERHIIATGGGMPMHPMCAARLKKMGFIVHLTTPKEVLYERFHKREVMPPYLPRGALRESFHKLYQERLPLYRSIAHLGVDPTNEVGEETILTQYHIFKRRKFNEQAPRDPLSILQE